MTEQTNYERAMDYSIRADPFERYAAMRKTPVERQPDGTFVISSYNLVQALFHDPRVSSDLTKRNAPPPKQDGKEEPLPSHLTDLSEKDPPHHDLLRRLAMRQFGPPNKPRFIYDFHGTLGGIVDDLIDGLSKAPGHQVDLIEHFAYPYPVAVIVKLLGVPHEDTHKIEEWTHDISSAGSLEELKVRSATAFHAINAYMADLIEKHRTNPSDNMLSGMIHDDGPEGRLDKDDLIATASLLLSAGHETTVNLIGSGLLLLLERPDLRERVISEPEYVIRFVEELLRCETPIQYLHQRSALADMEVTGTTIPKGSPIMLMLGAANRDDTRFANADEFNADRPDNQHLGFGSGQHNCFGAPLARREAQIAFVKFFERVKNPRMIGEAVYRKNPMTRGPEKLVCEFDSVSPTL